MSLSDQDLREIHLLAREIAGEVCKQVNIEHVQNCPHGQEIKVAKIRNRSLAAGIGIGLAIVGATSGGAAALVMKLLGSL